MERIGRIRGLINRPLSTRETPTTVHVVEEVARACRRLSERRHGALLILEQETGLQEFIESGVEIDALTSMDVLITVFFPNSPLHDGAAIIRGDRIIAAGCVLPLSTSSQSHDLGTRHRAALGITEETDALAVVVSEETGSISVANDGRLVRHLDDARLKKVLTSLYHPPTHDVFHLWPISRTLADKSGDR
jgi:diadenylate cyclase